MDYTDSYEECGTADSLMRHVYSGIQCIEEHHWCVGSSTVWELSREFVWGERFPEPVAMVDWTAAGDAADGVEEIVHYLHDSLGNIVGLTDKGNPGASPPVPGKLVERYAYDPYGKPYIQYWNSGTSTWQTKPRSEFNNPFLWTGQRYDAGGSSSTKSVGLYHFLFRSYSPELGRWMQRDPLGYVDGVNLYEAMMSLPVHFTDPLGQDVGWAGRGPNQNWPYGPPQILGPGDTVNDITEHNIPPTLSGDVSDWDPRQWGTGAPWGPVDDPGHAWITCGSGAWGYWPGGVNNGKLIDPKEEERRNNDLPAAQARRMISTPLKFTGEGSITYGPRAGQSCLGSTDADVESCLSECAARYPVEHGPYTGTTNNCQVFSVRCMGSCCLSR